MGFEKKALVLIQGIHESEYIRNSLDESKYPLKEYDRISVVKTEEQFDKYSFDMKFWDKYGDFIKYFLNPFRRRKVVKEATQVIKELSSSGFTVDVMAHSLGSLIALSTKTKIRQLLLFGSPIAFFNGWVARICRLTIGRKIRKMDIQSIFFCWSKNDLICNNFSEKIKNFLSKAKVKQVFGLESGSDHTLSQYLKDFIKLKNAESK